MHVLIVLDTFLPAVCGGSELYCLGLAKGLQSAGHEVLVFHTDRDDSPGVKNHIVDDVRCAAIHRMPSYSGHGNFFGGAIEEVDAEYRRILDDFRPNVVHINHLKRLSPNIPRLSGLAGAAVIVTCHDYWLVCDRSSLLYNEKICSGPEPTKCADCNRNRYARWSHFDVSLESRAGRVKQSIKDLLYHITERRPAIGAFARRTELVQSIVDDTDYFISPSPFLLSVMRRYGIPHEKSMHLAYGMDTSAWEDPSPRKRNGRLVCGYFGGMSNLKGVDVLLKAFDSFSDAELRIYGRRYQNKPLLEESIMAQENVTYEGVVSGQTKTAAYADVDVVIVPSVWYENSPLVIHEAFLAGKPVITSNIGGMADLVAHEVSGLLFEAGNASELRSAIQKLSSSTGLLERLQSGIPKVVSMPEHIASLTAIYDRALNQTGKSAALAT